MPTYTLWEMLSGAILVFADEDTQTLITWNESATFNVYTPDGDLFSEVTAFVAMGVTNEQHARAHAKEWFEESVFASN